MSKHFLNVLVFVFMLTCVGIIGQAQTASDPAVSVLTPETQAPLKIEKNGPCGIRSYLAAGPCGRWGHVRLPWLPSQY